MTGLVPFSLEKEENFLRTLGKIVKSYKSQSEKQKFIEFISQWIEEIIRDPQLPKSRNEPLPKNCPIQEGWQFRKLSLIYGLGASGQIRLMYLFNDEQKIIKVLWIYSHKDFEKRPPDNDIKDIIQNALGKGD